MGPRSLAWTPAAVAIALTASLLAPRSGSGFTTSGSALGLDQRDVRVLDNFTDASANDNQQEHPSFPGFTGAELAIWKAAVEWGSELHGDGQGDPAQSDGLGSGGANFDATWQGLAVAPGGPNDNVHSEIAAEHAGVYAYCEVPSSDGWRIRYYSSWEWHDGPGSALFSPVDLQGVATHEYGHALGLGHSSSASATMYAAVAGSGVALRSIEADDMAGVRAVYGVKAADKPRITGVAVQASVLTIDGAGFAPEDNEVWLTRGTPGGDGTPVRATGLPAQSGGTRITLAVPPEAGPGDVLVRRPGSSGSALSNAWPLDPLVDGASGGPPSIAAITPNPAPAVTAGPNTVRLAGQGFAGALSVTLDGVALPAAAWSVLGDTVLDLELPLQDALGAHAVLVVNAAGPSAPATLWIVAPDAPVLWLRDPVLLSTAGADLTLGGGPGDLAWLAVSPQLSPSSLPGVVELSIGAQFSALFLLAEPVLPAQAWVHWVLPLAGLPFGTALHFQAAVLDLETWALPLEATNVETGIFYF